jgi:hypothetical protein
MLAGHHSALTLPGRKDLDPWEVNTERSYYEEQVLTPDKSTKAPTSSSPTKPRRTRVSDFPTNNFAVRQHVFLWYEWLTC